jgi:hypothetical protein
MLDGDPFQRPSVPYLLGAMAWRTKDAIFLGDLVAAVVDAVSNVRDSTVLSPAQKDAMPASQLWALLSSADPFINGQSASRWVLGDKDLQVSGMNVYKHTSQMRRPSTCHMVTCMHTPFKLHMPGASVAWPVQDSLRHNIL